jgi:hypothetical protein
VSYDVQIATRMRPAVDGLDDVTVDGPVAAEADDLPAALAAAVLSPRWLTTLSVPVETSARRREAVRTLGRRLARDYDGAAFDPQEDAVIWPRGRPRRARAITAERTSLVRLGWYVEAARWPAAPAALLAAIARRCREALPTRYGDFEPLQNRFDPAAPQAFLAFAAEQSAFWFASRPFFGGHAHPPDRLGVDLDWRVLDSDPAWRETVVDLFAAVAEGAGAFYAEGWVEPGWNVASNNRLSIAAGRETRGPAHGRDGWQGLPAEPAWLSWFGGDYREPVAAALADATPARRGLRRALTPTVDARPEGVFVRLGEAPRAKLPSLPLPPELVRPR